MMSFFKLDQDVEVRDFKVLPLYENITIVADTVSLSMFISGRSQHQSSFDEALDKYCRVVRQAAPDFTGVDFQNQFVEATLLVIKKTNQVQCIIDNEGDVDYETFETVSKAFEVIIENLYAVKRFIRTNPNYLSTRQEISIHSEVSHVSSLILLLDVEFKNF